MFSPELGFAQVKPMGIGFLDAVLGQFEEGGFL
jgi:hypothetical protein